MFTVANSYSFNTSHSLFKNCKQKVINTNVQQIITKLIIEPK